MLDGENNKEGVNMVSMAKKIYIAEDDPALLKMLQTVLALDNRYEVTFFSDGLELYNKVLVEPPDLLVLDILIPSLSGLAITRLLKFEDNYRHIPVIIISSVTDSDIREQVKNAGGDIFLPKPFQPDRLFEMLEECLWGKVL